MKKVASNSNWKAVKVGTEFMVTDEIYAILEKKNYIGEVKQPLIAIVDEPEPEPKAKK
jgi:hypothetical protein